VELITGKARDFLADTEPFGPLDQAGLDELAPFSA
jgi:hypothetical protein